MEKRKPLTFHTFFRILEACSFLVNLNRNRLGPITAKEKGVAKNQAFVMALIILSFLGYYSAIRGSNSKLPCSRGIDSS